MLRIFVVTLTLLALLTNPLLAETKKTTSPDEKSPSIWKTYFNDGLLDNQNNPVDAALLDGKIIALYFSAHWCPPCRHFTPELVKFRDKNQKDFEVVFISSDKNPKAKLNYMKETKMKWFTLKHKSDTANALSKKFKIVGIPSLVILNSKGELITKDGRQEIMGEPEKVIKKWKNK
jgi:nucleoredoxin